MEKIGIADLPTKKGGIAAKIIELAKSLKPGEAALVNIQMSHGNHAYLNYKLSAMGFRVKIVTRGGKVYVVSTL
jgi:hypothetical protein